MYDDETEEEVAGYDFVRLGKQHSQQHSKQYSRQYSKQYSTCSNTRCIMIVTY